MDTRAEPGYAANWTTEGTSGGTTVTEAKWLACTDPQPMLTFLKGRASDRKMRLFICACCRRVWRRLIDRRSRVAVEIGEVFADGAASDAEREAARGVPRDCHGAQQATVLGGRDAHLVGRLTGDVGRLGRLRSRSPSRLGGEPGGVAVARRRSRRRVGAARHLAVLPSHDQRRGPR